MPSLLSLLHPLQLPTHTHTAINFLNPQDLYYNLYCSQCFLASARGDIATYIFDIWSPFDNVSFWIAYQPVMVALVHFRSLYNCKLLCHLNENLLPNHEIPEGSCPQIVNYLWKTQVDSKFLTIPNPLEQMTLL